MTTSVTFPTTQVKIQEEVVQCGKSLTEAIEHYYNILGADSDVLTDWDSVKKGKKTPCGPFTDLELIDTDGYSHRLLVGANWFFVPFWND